MHNRCGVNVGRSVQDVAQAECRRILLGGLVKKTELVVDQAGEMRYVRLHRMEDSPQVLLLGLDEAIGPDLGLVQNVQVRIVDILCFRQVIKGILETPSPILALLLVVSIGTTFVIGTTDYTAAIL